MYQGLGVTLVQEPMNKKLSLLVDYQTEFALKKKQ